MPDDAHRRIAALERRASDLELWLQVLLVWCVGATLTIIVLLLLQFALVPVPHA